MHSVTQLYSASCMSDVSFLHEARGPFSTGHRVSRVLLAIDDPASLETLALFLADIGVAVEAAPTRDAFMRALDWGVFDLLVIDLRIGGSRGLDIVRELRARDVVIPFVLVAAGVSVSEIVEAMQLGARTVLEPTLAEADLADAIMRELGAGVRTASAAPAISAMAGAPARRWAGHVLAAVNAASDPRTLADWSRAIGVSRTVLIESCARLGIVPRDARDLARVLRLVRRADEPWDPETTLDVADRRTLRTFLERAGLTEATMQIRPTPQQFLARQRFVAQTNPGLAALRRLIDE